MAKFLLFCKACDARFEPITPGEQCPRCKRDETLAKLDDLKATLSAMNELALGPVE